MATSRATVGAVLGTVTDTANAISGVVNSVANGMDMLNSYVKNEQAKQRLRHLADLSEYETVLSEQLSTQEAERKKKIADLCKDEESATYYNSAYSKFTTLFNEARAAKAA